MALQAVQRVWTSVSVVDSDHLLAPGVAPKTPARAHDGQCQGLIYAAEIDCCKLQFNCSMFIGR